LKLAVAGIAAWLSVMAGALFTSLQLWLSGTSQLQIVIPAMLSVHALIGLGEALITVAALTFILQTRPDLLGENSASAQGSRGWVLAGLLISLAVVLLSPLASANPDGLERVAGDLGFLSKGASAPYQIIPDYTLPFLGQTHLSTILAGLIGLIVVGAIIVLLGQGLRAKS
jgi:cobalt/nickel transport system permease protein